jgi:hypothetical protein
MAISVGLFPLVVLTNMLMAVLTAILAPVLTAIFVARRLRRLAGDRGPGTQRQQNAQCRCAKLSHDALHVPYAGAGRDFPYISTTIICASYSGVRAGLVHAEGSRAVSARF